jgi:methionyl-tRNA formyltransferase
MINSNNPSLIAICGNGQCATSSLSFCWHLIKILQLDIPIVVCPNRSDSGYAGWQSSLIAMANDLKVKIVDLNFVENEEKVLLLSIHYDTLFKTANFKSNRLFNLHFSNLPKYRGLYTAILPILHGESEVGVTLHKVDDGIDTGDIVAQRTFNLPEDITARELYDRYEQQAFMLFQETFLKLFTQDYKLTSQDNSQASYFSKKSLDFNNLEIDLQWSSGRIDRFIRAFHFPEYQLPKLNGRSIWKCNVLSLELNVPVATEISESNYSSIYSAGDGKLLEIIWA